MMPPPGMMMRPPGMMMPGMMQGQAGAGPSSAAAAAAAAAAANAQKPGQPAGTQKKGLLREAAGKRWRDPTLDEWPENDFRVFVGNLGNDVNDEVLAKAFQKYPTFAKAKVCSCNCLCV